MEQLVILFGERDTAGPDRYRGLKTRPLKRSRYQSACREEHFLEVIHEWNESVAAGPEKRSEDTTADEGAKTQFLPASVPRPSVCRRAICYSLRRGDSIAGNHPRLPSRGFLPAC